MLMCASASVSSTEDMAGTEVPQSVVLSTWQVHMQGMLLHVSSKMGLVNYIIGLLTMKSTKLTKLLVCI